MCDINVDSAIYQVLFSTARPQVVYCNFFVIGTLVKYGLSLLVLHFGNQTRIDTFSWT